MAVLLALVSGLGNAVAAEPWQARSGEQRTALVELFTSEGCSSCPPADAWMTQLKDSPGLWREFVPVAYHVDYWDYLGWKDVLAQKDFTERQRAYAGSWRTDSIYTPEMVLNGREWRNWRGSTKFPPMEQLSGVLEMTSNDRKLWQVKFRNTAPAAGRYQVTVALLGCGLSSEVKAGENEGRKLGHDFVVLKLKQAALSPAEGALSATVELSDEVKFRAAKLAMVVWVTKAGSFEPVQATGGWLTK